MSNQPTDNNQVTPNEPGVDYNDYRNLTQAEKEALSTFVYEANQEDTNPTNGPAYYCYVSDNIATTQLDGNFYDQTGGTAMIYNTTGGSSSYNPSTGEVTVPVDGRYRVTIGEGAERESGNITQLVSYARAGTQLRRVVAYQGLFSMVTGTGVAVFDLQAGDPVWRRSRIDGDIRERYNAFLEVELIQTA
jgi:hypothetical protein